MTISRHSMKYKIIEGYLNPYGKDVPNIEADHTQINQMVMNLIVNAVEAIKDRGTIIISTDEEEIHDFAEYKYIADELKPLTINHIAKTISCKAIGRVC